MNLKKLLLITLSIFITAGYAQKKTSKTTSKPVVTTKDTPKKAMPKMGKNVIKIVVKDQSYYLTKEIGYTITGNYTYEGNGGNPIVQLNEDGTGLFQLHEMGQTPMVWGIECEMDGTPKKQESSFGAVYLLWYQIKEKHKGKTWESGVIDSWDAVQFSIHFNEKKMYILGERIKNY